MLVSILFSMRQNDNKDIFFCYQGLHCYTGCCMHLGRIGACVLCIPKGLVMIGSLWKKSISIRSYLPPDNLKRKKKIQIILANLRSIFPFVSLLVCHRLKILSITINNKFPAAADLLKFWQLCPLGH